MTIPIVIKCEGAECPESAVFTVRIHQTDGCQNKECVDGSRLFTLCAECVKSSGKRLIAWIKSALDILPEIDGEKIFLCATCDKRIAQLHDVFEVEGL